METLHILSPKGVVLYSCLFRPTARTDVPELFDTTVRAVGRMDPIISLPEKNITLLQFNTRHLIYVATTSTNASALTIFAFLAAVDATLAELLGTTPLRPNDVTANLLTVSEVLDEVIDDGLPVTTDLVYLRDMLALKTVRAQKLGGAATSVTMQATGRVTHRKEGIMHSENTLYLDVVENISALITPEGTPVRVEVSGEVRMKSLLSGMPECHLVFSRPAARSRVEGSKEVALDNVMFHNCVRLSQYEDDRTLSFIPPDGQTLLMRYRVGGGSLASVTIPFRVTALSRQTGRDVVVDVAITSTVSKERDPIAPALLARISLPPGAAAVDAKLPRGCTGRIDLANGVYVVRCRDFVAGETRNLQLRVSLGAECSSSLHAVGSMRTDGYGSSAPKIHLTFNIKGIAVSGLRIVSFAVTESRLGYKAGKFVRYETVAENDSFVVSM